MAYLKYLEFFLQIFCVQMFSREEEKKFLDFYATCNRYLYWIYIVGFIRQTILFQSEFYIYQSPLSFPRQRALVV